MDERLAWLRRQTSTQGLAEQLEELVRSSSWREAMPMWIALLERTNRWEGAAMQWMAVGGPARALDNLERCVSERTSYLGLALRSPSFHALNGEPRFQSFERMLKLDGRIAAVAL
jgi:hypothetical protein